MKAKREIAFKVRIKDLLENKYVVSEGWEPNYIELDSKKISRVNVLGVVVGYQNELIKLDDGTGGILLRSFDNININLNPGDVVLVIGRPREYNNEKYLMPEIVKKIENPEWIKVRKLELGEGVEKKEIVEEEVKENNQSIIDVVKKLDSGDGVKTEEVVKKLNSQNSDEMIKKLLKEGELFEIKPGFIKVL